MRASLFHKGHLDAVMGLIIIRYIHEYIFVFLVIDVAIGLYGEWNWKLRKAIDSIDEKRGRWYEIDTKNAELPESRCCQPISSFLMFKRKVKDATKVCRFM